MLRARGVAQPFTLDPSRFTAASQITSVESTVAYFDVPLGNVLGLIDKQKFALRIKARVIRVFTASGALTRAVTGLQIARSPRSAPALPTSVHPDFVAFISNDGITYARTTITAVNYITGEVTVTKTATTTHIKLYYSLSAGEIFLKAFAPSGSDTERRMIFNCNAKVLHENDQISGDTPLTVLKTAKALPEEFRLELRVRTADEVVFAAEAEWELNIQAFMQPSVDDDRTATYAAALERLKGD
jgi:hypothetical protein